MEKPNDSAGEEVTLSAGGARINRYLQGSLNILRTSLKLGGEGQPEFYRVAAAQLRLLLCDTTRRHDRIEDISLAVRVFPDLAFHPLVGNKFDRNRFRIPLKNWLAQPLPEDENRAAPAIREFIRQICDNEGGVHFDPKNLPAEGSEKDYGRWIQLIGGYVLAELESRMQLLEG